MTMPKIDNTEHINLDVAKHCTDFMDMLRRLINYRIIIIGCFSASPVIKY